MPIEEAVLKISHARQKPRPSGKWDQDAHHQTSVLHLASNWRQPEILQVIFDRFADSLFIYDRDLRIVGANQAARQLFETVTDELIGKRCQEWFKCARCESNCAILQSLRDAPYQSRGTVNLHLSNGSERMVVIETAQLHDDAGAMQGVLATVKDITAGTAPPDLEIVAESQPMREILSFVRRVAASDAASVLIEGENGTGKDLIAKTLHYQSLRRSAPFLAINCAAIPETLLESELFGYEKGAFTDARTQKMGLFELANNGTLFLDEIGELPFSLQAKLLRVLEEQCFRRLGGLRDIHVNIRIIAATNKNLRVAVREGAFRQDLYYRLNVIQLVVPPLRERAQDILPLACFFIGHYNNKFKRDIQGLTSEAETLLLTCPWPGNVRELRNAVEHAMILEDSAHIQPANLPLSVGSTSSREEIADAPIPFSDQGLSLTEQERRLIVQALAKTRGNQTRASQLLSITRDALRYKMKKFKLH